MSYIPRPGYHNQNFHFPYIRNCLQEGDIYDFGTGGGALLECLIETLRANDIKFNSVYALDSFLGLPHEMYGIPFLADWRPGNYNTCKLYGCNLEETLNCLKIRFNEFNEDIHIISGYFIDTLNKALIKQYNMKPASYVSIDVDLYISTYQVLTFLFQNKLVQKGTMIRYDDWQYQDWEEGTFGNSLAHNQITEIYKVKWERRSIGGKNGPPTFFIKDYE